MPFFDKIKYFIGLRSSITYVDSFNYANNNFPLEKTLAMLNDLILVKSVFNKNYNQYYYKTFLENVHTD